jgi:Subtilase family
MTSESRYHGHSNSNCVCIAGLTGRDYLKIPELDKIFDSAYRAGARVHTNSWGNVGGIYGQLSMDVDKYLHQHEDFFVLFAGGNEGYSGLRSVIAPGNAKNCLTVGATQLRTVAQDEELDDPVRGRTCVGLHISKSHGRQHAKCAVLPTSLCRYYSCLLLSHYS